MRFFLIFLISFLLACQAPLPLSPVSGQIHGLQAVSELPPGWDALPQLSPSEQDSLTQALAHHGLASQALSNGSQDKLRPILEALLPVLEKSYQDMIHPRVIHADRLPPGSRAVSLRSHDGLELQAAYLPALQPTTQAVIVLHGYQLNKYMAWKKYGFLQQRYNLLLLDLRGHNGQAGAVTLGVLGKRDLPNAIHWLQHNGNQSFALFGESMGGALAIVAGSEWSQSPEQAQFPLKAVWNDAAYADLEHAISERVLRKLAQEIGLSPAFLQRWAAQLITHTFLVWLAQDTGVPEAEAAAAPRNYLPQLASRVAYGQVHSLEDEQTSVENAQILENLARSATVSSGAPSLFWYTHGKHVESWQQPDYASRSLNFLQRAFTSP